jgi:hypothetical protein
MLFCGVIGPYGIECLLIAKGRRFFVAEISDEKYEEIAKLLRANRTEEAEKLISDFSERNR